MSVRMGRAIIALTWTVAAVVVVLITVWPAFRNLFGLEAFPIGCLAGWTAHSGMVARRRR